MSRKIPKWIGMILVIVVIIIYLAVKGINQSKSELKSSPKVSPTSQSKNIVVLTLSPTSTITPKYKTLSVKRSAFIDYLNKYDKNFFATFYEANCDHGEGDYVTVFYCSSKDDLIFASYTIKNPKLTTSPLSQDKLFEKLSQTLRLFNSSLVNTGWFSNAIKTVTDDKPIEISQNEIKYEISSTVGDYSFTVNGEIVPPAKDSSSYYVPIVYPKYYNLGTYQTSGRFWKAIRISPFITEEEIISLAKEIHASDSIAEYKIFDDDDKAEYEKYKYWEENYPEGEYDTWASERYVGSIQKFPHPQTNKLVWTLVSRGNILKKDYILE